LRPRVIAGAESRLGILRRESTRQADQGRRLRALLIAMAPIMVKHISWLSQDGGTWDAVLSACGPTRYGALAASLGLDAAVVVPRDVFMAGLTTVGTYGRAWDLALRFSAGAAHETLADIRRIENTVNGLVRGAFHGASYYYRGESVLETLGAHLGTVGAAWHYSYVSLSSDLAAAPWFASRGRHGPGGAKVVLAVDARRARGLGIFPATYSMASDALNLPRSREGTRRTFPARNADELQVHFCDRRPPGSGEAMEAIITVGTLPPGDRRMLEATGVPVVAGEDVFPRGF